MAKNQQQPEQPIEAVDEPVAMDDVVEAEGTGVAMEGIEVPVDEPAENVMAGPIGFNFVSAPAPVAEEESEA